MGFTDSVGHVFQPERLVILTPEGAQGASIPATTNHASSEEHLDLSGLPLLGHLFRDRLAPGDARRCGVFVGPLARGGNALVLGARETRIDPAAREIVLTANFPRDGAVSYWLGRLGFSSATPPAGPARSAGSAWLVGDALVLAGPGYGPGIENLDGAIGDLV